MKTYKFRETVERDAKVTGWLLATVVRRLRSAAEWQQGRAKRQRERERGRKDKRETKENGRRGGFKMPINYQRDCR